MLRLDTVGDRSRAHLTGLCAVVIPAVSVSFILAKLKLASQVSSHLFCHSADAEALQMTYDPSLVTYRKLLEFFYRMHDATTLNRQGPDVGTQYRSVIFTHGAEQQKIAESITDKVSKEWFKQPVSTQVVPAGQWWDAEDYHQLYLNKNPAGYECPAQYVSLGVLDGLIWFL